jgi:hypothetical protein
MSFSVLWTQEAFDSIAEIVATSTNPEQITRSIRELDRELSHEPATKGESRSGGRRIIFCPPLAALYEVHWRMNEVVIGEVWKFGQHGSA